jgi:cation:H+ antiporter
MLLQVVLFLVGLTLLYFGADWLVKGASALALHFGIRPIVVGLTVVALGTSMPEFVVSVAAALDETQDGGELALGNIVGSNIANIGLILGLSALVAPLMVQSTTLQREYPFFVAVMALFFGLSLDSRLGRFDGIVLVAALAGFLIYLILDTRARSKDSRAEEALDAALTDAGMAEDVGLEPPQKDTKASMAQRVVLIVVGTVLLAVGAKLMVDAATFVAFSLGISQTVVGLTVVAIGTSLPELAASVVGAAHGEEEMSLGNVLGSNILNVLFVIGTVAIIAPLPVDGKSLNIFMPVMLVFSVVILPLAWTNRTIARWEGGVLLAGFVGFITYSVWPYLP